jgi:peptidoglycan/xylan/chitin deacetylase (PgdA/CDA1 family)
MLSMHPAVAAAGRAAHVALGARDRALGPRAGLTLVGWHAVAKAGSGLRTTFDEFRRHLDAIAAYGTVVGLDAGVTALTTQALPPRAVALTFDDGYAGVAELAWPELKARGWPATLFAVSGYLDRGKTFPWDDPAAETARLLTADELAAVARDGLDVGSHTVSHRWLPHLPAAEVAAEVRESKAALEALLGKPVTSFAYPMGGWDAAVRDAVAAAGYDLAVTVDRGRNIRRTDRYALRRAFAPPDAGDLARILSGAYTFLRPLDSWRTRNGPAWQPE